MLQIRCRNCGHAVAVPDFHGALLIACPHCAWQEMHPPRRRLSKTPEHAAGAAYQAHQRQEALAGRVREHASGLGVEPFRRFCVELLEHLGYEVTEVEGSAAEDPMLELKKGVERTIVACRGGPPEHQVQRPELENLDGSMRRGHVEQGRFLTTGTFGPTCAELAEETGIDLVDGAALEKLLVTVEGAWLRGQVGEGEGEGE